MVRGSTARRTSGTAGRRRSGALPQETAPERGSAVVVFAGYRDGIKTFLASDPGLSSRVVHPVEFAHLTHQEPTASPR